MPAQTEISSIQALLAQAFLITILLKKDISKIIKPKEYFTFNKVINLQKISNNTQKDPSVIQTFNGIKDQNLVQTQLLSILSEYVIHLEFYI